MFRFEIRVLISEGAKVGAVEEDKRHMLHGIFQLFLILVAAKQMRLHAHAFHNDILLND